LLGHIKAIRIKLVSNPILPVDFTAGPEVTGSHTCAKPVPIQVYRVSNFIGKPWPRPILETTLTVAYMRINVPKNLQEGLLQITTVGGLGSIFVEARLGDPITIGFLLLWGAGD
jgi:hypothetical protein